MTTYYTSDELMTNWDNAGIYDMPGPLYWASLTLNDAMDQTLAWENANQILIYSDSVCTWDAPEVEVFIDPDIIHYDGVAPPDWNWSASYQTWTRTINVSSVMGGDFTIDCLFFSIPDSYDYTLPSPDAFMSDSGLIIQLPGNSYDFIYAYDPKVVPPGVYKEFELAWQDDGLWHPPTDPQDPDTPLKYYPSVSTVKVKFGDSTNRYATVTPSKDGGFLIYETDSEGVPIGDIRVFRHDRTLKAIVKSDELASWSPRT